MLGEATEMVRYMVERGVTSNDLDAIERYVDRFWNPKNLDLDLQRSKHFHDRTNDERDGKYGAQEITPKDIATLFIKIGNEKDNDIKKLQTKDAVLRDKNTKLNAMSAISKHRDRSGKKITTVTPKSIIRRKDFKTHKGSPMVTVDESNKE